MSLPEQLAKDISENLLRLDELLILKPSIGKVILRSLKECVDYRVVKMTTSLSSPESQ